ncbi:9856_t:CDS:2, partial [Racocetra fulgida]
MSSRNAKKHANKKISLNNSNKRGRKKQAVVSPSDDLNELLNDTTILKSTSTKRGRKKKQQEEIVKIKEDTKKKHEMVASQTSQIITELLKDSVSNNNDDNDGILSDGNISNDSGVLNNDERFNDSDSFNDYESVAQDFATISLRPISLLKTESNNQRKSMFNSRSNNQIQNDIISLNRIASSRPMSISDSESRNELDISNRTSRIKLTTVPDSRTNSQIDYISLNRTLRSRPMSPLESGDNMMNIRMNNTCNVMNNSTIHFDTTDNSVPSSFNKMMIYQLCSWLCENPNILQLANNMNLSMQAPVIERLQLMPSNSPGSLAMLQPREDKTKTCRDFLEELKYLFLRIQNLKKSVFEELVLKIFKCELNSAEGI